MIEDRRTRGRLRLAVVGSAVALGLLPVGTASAQQPRPSPTPARPIDIICANLAPDYQPFGDLRSEVFRLAIRCQAAAGITEGTGQYTYAPGAPVTRAQMASFIARMMDTAVDLQDPVYPALDPLAAYNGSNRFTDVGAGDDHLANINRLAVAGITQGGPGGLPSSSYAPGASVTREQMATFIVRALEHLGGPRNTGQDYFDDDATSRHQANINAVAFHGIAVGVGDRQFRPGAVLNREQMSAFLVRSLAALWVSPIPADEPVAYLPCENPDGFTVSYPETWFTDETCTYFHPQPFEVPYGTDENFAAVTAKRLPTYPIDPDFGVIEDREINRRAVTIDGRPGTRLESESTGEGLWPDGIRTLAYSVDLDEEYLTLYTIGTDRMDYGNNKAVLDKMAPTVDIVD